MADLGRLERDINTIVDAYEVVSEYQFYLHGDNAPRSLGVKILRGSDGQYTPSMSHYVQRTGAAGAHYPSFDTFPTEEEAVQAVFHHGLMNYDPEDTGANWEKNDFF